MSLFCRPTAPVAAILTLLGLACGKDHASSSAADNASAAVARPDGGTSAAPAAPQASAPARATAAWQGSYKSVQGSMYIPPDWKDVHWKLKDTELGLGEGTMLLHVDPATGRASGTLDGPLGPATVDGVVSDGKLTASIAPKEPTDQGFTGTVIGAVTTGRLEGTMNLSSALVSAVRMATFALTPASAKALAP